jgi:hypothetical protein
MNSKKIPKTRARAKQLGTLLFSTGKKCRNGHIANRYTSNSMCIECAIAHRKANVTKYRAYSHKTFLKNRERSVWRDMKNRCNNPKHRDFKNYGGRGIKVCVRWKSYDNFLADMGRCPKDKRCLDRTNNDGNYEPGNCQWVTFKESLANKRHGRIYKNNTSGTQGVSFEKRAKSWKAGGGYKHLGYFKKKEDAIKARKNWEATQPRLVVKLAREKK